MAKLSRFPRRSVGCCSYLSNHEVGADLFLFPSTYLPLLESGNHNTTCVSWRVVSFLHPILSAPSPSLQSTVSSSAVVRSIAHQMHPFTSYCYFGTYSTPPADEEPCRSFHSLTIPFSTDASDNSGVMDSNESENLAALSANHLLQQLQQPQLAQPNPLPALPALPAQHQLLAVGQSTPPRQYTTVGSVYNPQHQPLQPPVRRGRTIKSLYPYKGESPAGPSQVQYTPLQQNSDRAVSPVRQEFSSLPSTLPITRQERQVLQKFGVVVPSMHQSSSLPIARQSPAQAPRYMGSREADGLDTLVTLAAQDNTAVLTNTSVGSDDGSDATDIKPISAMNFNSLTNLASYPNPMQRAAQKLLASHRPQPVQATGVSPSNAYPNGRILQSDGAITDIGSQSQISDSHSAYCDTETEPFISADEASRFMSALPKICGAPAPLTAGPPGVRQLRQIAIEQETLQRAPDFDDEIPVINPYRARPPLVSIPAVPPLSTRVSPRERRRGRRGRISITMAITMPWSPIPSQPMKH